LNLERAVQQLLVSPISGALFALDVAKQAILIWEIPTNDDPRPDPSLAIYAGNNPRHMALTHNGRHLYVAGLDDSGNGTITVTAVANLENSSEFGITGRPLRIAISYDDQYLYVLSEIDTAEGVRPGLTRYDISDPLKALTQVGQTAQFDVETIPVDLAIAPGDRWAYLYLQDTLDAAATPSTRLRRKEEALVVPYRLEKLESATPELVATGFGKVIDVGNFSLFSYLTFRGEKLYAASGNPETPPTNQIAVIEVVEEPCDDIFKQAVDGCPACAEESGADDHCVILATINNYTFGVAIDNEAIDNLTDRRIVPSTTSITEVVHCIIEQGVGQGIPGPRGPKGDAGSGLKGVVAGQLLPAEPTPTPEQLLSYNPITEILTLNPVQGKTGREIEAAEVTWPPDWKEEDRTNAVVKDVDGKLTLALKLPRDSGKTTKTHINALSWIHGRPIASLSQFYKLLSATGLAISFDNAIQFSTVTPYNFQVWVRYVDDSNIFIHECYLPLTEDQIQGFEVTTLESVDEHTFLIVDGDLKGRDEPNVKAIVIQINREEVGRMMEVTQKLGQIDSFGVRLRCDFILNAEGEAVDGNFIGGFLPTGNGVPGDDFESWIPFVSAK
jgi:hypothetical protein